LTVRKPSEMNMVRKRREPIVTTIVNYRGPTNDASAALGFTPCECDGRHGRLRICRTGFDRAPTAGWSGGVLEEV
jgi:hypothetical protein